MIYFAYENAKVTQSTFLYTVGKLSFVRSRNICFGMCIYGAYFFYARSEFRRRRFLAVVFGICTCAVYTSAFSAEIPDSACDSLFFYQMPV